MNINQELFSLELKKGTGLANITDDFFAFLLKNNITNYNTSFLIVTSSLYEANMMYNTISNYIDNTYLFPMDDFITSQAVVTSPDLMIERLETMNFSLKKGIGIIITHMEGYLKFLPQKETYKKNIITITNGDILDRNKLLKNLYFLGYKKESIVSKYGEVAVRGFVIDIFSLENINPIRIELFGDEVVSIRTFDSTTQKSINELNHVEIYPFTENISIDESSKVNIFQYFDNMTTIYVDYNQILTGYAKLCNEIIEYSSYDKTSFFTFEKVRDTNAIYLFKLDDNIKEISNSKIVNFNVQSQELIGDNKKNLNSYLTKQLEKGKTIIICLDDRQYNQIDKYLSLEFVYTNISNIRSNLINVIKYNLLNGFQYDNYIFMSFKNVSGSNNLPIKKKTKSVDKLKDIEKLSIGDYVVHEIYGIGIYNGIKTITKDGKLKDYLEILYLKSDKLYVPVNKIEYLNKYNGKDGSIPKINKLGGTEWYKTKKSVREKLKNIAGKILKIQAERELEKGFKFSSDSPLQIIFEEEFEYTLTPDQQSSLIEIKNDMEKITPMDRILCGDVGYGKTEVAFRAAFKAIADSKQVLYLCPTTILSNQQYENAKQRFKNFPVNIKLINRFTSQKDVNRIICDLKEGKIDMLFGTHRLLSNDIKPKDLGLLIVDEEQRFGVNHKEKIKEHKSTVDVLTLTATPIPRTLQLAMLGIRNISLIETPPRNRQPVQTYVIAESESLIREIVYKELSRNGQIYILYNRVADIELKLSKLKKLVPTAKITYAHGQMEKNELENRMIKFINKEYDILLCTTIIETGIDIPNVNTLIILEADKFGLSQLYQIRGRVGRSDKIAYAYLMYNKDKSITETATKRLKVIKEFTELGSGLSIATRDLSIRGAGDILGSEQAGFIDTVGIDLYMKMLDEEVRRLKGEAIEEAIVDGEVISLNVNNHISDEYVSEDILKIEIHKAINKVSDKTSFEMLKIELEDRFGKLDENLIIYMYEEWLEKLIKKHDVKKIVQNDRFVEIIFSKEKSEKTNYEDLFIKSIKISSNFKFKYINKELIITLFTNGLEYQPIKYLICLLEKM